MGEGLRVLRSLPNAQRATLTPPTAIRVLISYVTAGAGHRRAAEALAQAVSAAFPTADVQCRDLLDDVPRIVRRGYPWTYDFLVRHLASVWGTCFEWFDRRPLYAIVQPFRRAWNLLVARRFIRRLRQAPPDVIITTHFFPADVVSACKAAGWLTAPLMVAVTDLHPHRFWLSPEADAYICGTHEGAREAQERGVPPERLHALGIPIGRAFHAVVDRSSALRQFGLGLQRRTVLVMSGGTTVGPFEAVVEALIRLEERLPGRLQLLMVCGDSPHAMQRVRHRAQGAAMPARVFGFIEQMPEAMAVSDLIVAKAGGMTMSEALGRGVPLVIYYAIPGQEQFNAQYVAAQGAAVIADSPEEVAQAVCRFFEDQEQAAHMRKAAAALSRPYAAEAIVSQVVKPLLQSVGGSL